MKKIFIFLALLFCATSLSAQVAPKVAQFDGWKCDGCVRHFDMDGNGPLPIKVREISAQATTPATSTIQPPPPLLPTQTAASAALGVYQGWLETSLSILGANQAADEARQTTDEATINTLNSANSNLSAQVGALQGQLTALQQTVGQLQQQIIALQQGQHAATYALAYSALPDRSNPVNLQGATIIGAAYIYSAALAALGNDNPTGVVSVSYWLDAPTTAPPTHVETGQPWDFQGGATNSANPWNSASVPNGPHTLIQVVTFTGGTETDTATFTVSNPVLSIN